MHSWLFLSAFVLQPDRDRSSFGSSVYRTDVACYRRHSQRPQSLWGHTMAGVEGYHLKRIYGTWSCVCHSTCVEVRGQFGFQFSSVLPEEGSLVFCMCAQLLESFCLPAFKILIGLLGLQTLQGLDLTVLRELELQSSTFIANVLPLNYLPNQACLFLLKKPLSSSWNTCCFRLCL